MMKNELTFRQELERVNDWWLTGRVRECEFFPIKRMNFEQVRKGLETQRAEIIIGPRRVGKSVLIKQLIASLIENGIKPTSILYYSMDDPSLYPFSDNLMKDMIDYFLENIAPKGRRYIFLDEVHLYKGWHRWVKAYYDRYPDIKFILSGSSTLALQKEAERLLYGRIMEINMYPMGFREFLRFASKEVKRYTIDELFAMKNTELRALGYGIREAFTEYLLVGGFPEWFVLRDKPDGVRMWFKRLVEDITKRAIYEDISSIYEIRNPKVLELILTFIVAHQSRVLAYETINEIAGLDRTTLINYIEFLKSAYMIVEVLKFAGIKEQMKAKKKYLVIDQGIRNALLKDYSLREENIGFVIENVIGISLYVLSKEIGEAVFYYKTNAEVDFILKGRETIPVEVKYRSQITEKDSQHLLGILKRMKSKKGIMITKDILKKEKINNSEILYIPAWAFLLTI